MVFFFSLFSFFQLRGIRVVPELRCVAGRVRIDDIAAASLLNWTERKRQLWMLESFRKRRS